MIYRQYSPGCPGPRQAAGRSTGAHGRCAGAGQRTGEKLAWAPVDGGLWMPVIIWLAASIAAVAAVATATMIIAWADGVGICDTWLSVILPLCR